jgi:hypothetical protein
MRRVQPNPVKGLGSDKRAKAYVRAYGYHSWELDALPPHALAEVINDAIEAMIDWDKWEAVEAMEDNAKSSLHLVAENFQPIINRLLTDGGSRRVRPGSRRR